MPSEVRKKGEIKMSQEPRKESFKYRGSAARRPGCQVTGR